MLYSNGRQRSNSEKDARIMCKDMWNVVLIFIGAVATTAVLVFRVIYRALNAGKETRLVAVASDRPEEVAAQVFHRLGKVPGIITNSNAIGGTKRKPELYFNISHHEMAFLESVVYDVDSDASIYYKK